MTKRMNCLLLAMIIVAAMTGRAMAECASGQCAPKNEKILSVVKAELKERTKMSGTLDLYDTDKARVRNLRMVPGNDQVSVKNNEYTVILNFRDMESGDIVEVSSLVVKDSTEWSVKELTMIGVKEKPKTDESAAKKEYSDEEIQKVMNDYLDSQVKFSDHLMLFDEERSKMRNLDLVELKTEVRRLGILNISRASFKDAESGEMLGIDVTVENLKGQLKVQSLRIRDVKRAKSAK